MGVTRFQWTESVRLAAAVMAIGRYARTGSDARRPAMITKRNEGQNRCGSAPHEFRLGHLDQKRAGIVVLHVIERAF